jgi:hypothetical protein
MNTLSKLIVIFCAFTITGTASASTTFDFATATFNRSLDGSLNFTSDGIGLNVTGYSFDGLGLGGRLDPDPATLPTAATNQNNSLGRNAGGLTFSLPGRDIARQDGVGLNELILFTFTQAVNLESIFFTDEDNDTFSFYNNVSFDGSILSGNFVGGPIATGNGLFSFGGSNIESGMGTTFAVAAIANDSSIQIGSLSAISAVPEPATWLMMIIGFAGIGLTVRRRQRVLA